MITFKQFLIEDQMLRSQLENPEYEVVVGGLWSDQPTLDIKGVGYIKLYWNGEYYAVHGIRGESRGAGTILYFAALEFITNHGLKPRTGMLASDTTLSPDAVRTRKRIQDHYGQFITVYPHPELEFVKTHKGTNERLPATPEEASMWKLKTLDHPFHFKFISENPQIILNNT